MYAIRSYYAWDPDSTYIRRPPLFTNMTLESRPITDIEGARVLIKVGDSVTTDHISPAGAIARGGPAGKYLREHGVQDAGPRRQPGRHRRSGEHGH